MLIIVSLYLLYKCIFSGVLSKNSIWCLKIYVGSEEVVNRWIQPREGEQSDVIICQDCLLCLIHISFLCKKDVPLLCARKYILSLLYQIINDRLTQRLVCPFALSQKKFFSSIRCCEQINLFLRKFSILQHFLVKRNSVKNIS